MGTAETDRLLRDVEPSVGGRPSFARYLINSPFEQTHRWLIFTLPCFLSPNPLTGGKIEL